MGKPWVAFLIATVGMTVASVGDAQVIPRPNLGVHTNSVRALAFTSSNELVSVGLDKVAYRWDLETGTSIPIRFPIGPDVQGAALDVVTGPAHLAIGLLGAPGADLATIFAVAKNESASIKVPGGVGKLAWSPKFDRLAAITVSESVVLVDTAGKVLWTQRLTPGAAPGRRDPRSSSISFSADGSELWVAFYQSANRSLTRLRLDAKSGEVKAGSQSLAGQLNGSVIDGSGNIAMISTDGFTSWWPAGQAQASKIGPKGMFGRTISRSPDGKALAVSLDGLDDRPGKIVLMEVPSGRVRGEFSSPTSPDALAFSPDSSRVGAVLFPSDIVVLNATNGQPIRQFARSGSVPVQIGWSEDGNSLLWTGDFSFVNKLGVPIPASRSFNFVERAVSSAPNMRIEPRSKAELRWDAAGKTVRARVPGINQEMASTATLSLETPPKLVALSNERFAAMYPSNGTEVLVLSVNQARSGLEPLARIQVPVAQVSSIALHPTRPLLAVGSIDQQTRFYLLPERGFPAGPLPTLTRSDLTLVTSNGGDWVIFNEDLGFYDSSAAGDRLIGFQRQTKDRVDFVPVSSLAEQFRKPNLVQEIMGGSRPASSRLPSTPAATAVAKVAGLDVLDVRGTELVRGAMSESDIPRWRTNKSEVEILLEVPPSVRTADIQVANGTGAKSAGDGLIVEIADEGRFTVTAKLFPGLNKIRVWANTRDGRTAEDIIEVERTGGTPRNDWNVFVLAVPEFNKLPALPAVAQDGQQVAEFFRAQNGKSGAVTVKQVPTTQTTTREIIQQLDDFTSSVKDGQNVLLYISSHGLPDDSGRYFIASRDIDAGNALMTGIDWDLVQERISKMNRSGARYVVLIVDSCFAGQAIASRAITASSNEPAMATMRALQGNTVLVTSSMPGQKSWTLTPEFLPRSMATTRLPPQGMSLFTHALLRGLRGELGAQDSAGRIKLSTLFAFVSQEVATVVRRYQEAAESGEKPDFRQVRQDPWRSPFDDDIVIAVAPGRP